MKELPCDYGTALKLILSYWLCRTPSYDSQTNPNLVHLIIITVEKRIRIHTEILLSTSNLTIICKVQNKILKSRLISAKGGKSPKRFHRSVKNLRQSTSPICLILPNTACVHSDPEGSSDARCTVPMQSSLFHSSPLQCFSFPSNTTDKVSPLVSSSLTEGTDNHSFTARTSYAS